ncbi:MAG: cysteine--tRNA ligase [candidate division Zixibacteria bacterium]|nr:cysteine--tRNA ligase [candidate division Zixibacteria bacterium]
MPVRFFDTRRRAMVAFAPLRPGEVRLYTCGPTVYNFAHVGNHRAYMFEDLLRRYLKWRGYRLTQIMNLTDIDDKIIRRCREQGIGLSECTAPYKKAFFEDFDSLRIERAEVYPEATAHIAEMVALVETLLSSGHAYRAEDGSIYFRIASFPRYGELSHMNLSELKAGARVAADEYEKDAVSDFALWKAWDADDGEVFWETSLGKGRPGWHLECSAMSMKYLGNTFDIHTGGVDNIFPHHENEIAQSESATGEPFVKYWLHCEHLIVDGRRMAKSLDNFYTLRDLLDRGYPAVAVRYLLLSTHYRSQLNFTMSGLEGAKSAIERIRDFHHRLGEVTLPGEAQSDFLDAIKDVRSEFTAQLDDDLNISGALGVLFNFIRDTYKRLELGELRQADAQPAREMIEDFDRILDVLRPDVSAGADAQRVEELIAEREEARARKDWQRADEIRALFDQMGIVVEDTPTGTRWKHKV